MSKIMTTTTAALMTGVLLMLLFSVSGTGRALAAQPAPAALAGVTWQWQETISATEVIAPDAPGRYTLDFLDDGRLAARLDCNRATGTFAVDGSGLTIRLLAVTRAACPPESRADAFARQVGDAGAFATDGDRLYIGLASTPAVMIFSRVAPAAPAASVTGVVTYRERIALPPDAVVIVRLEETSRADAPATLIGEQVIEAAGRQVPFTFAIAYDPALIGPNDRYTVRARIESPDGRLLWISTTAYFVVTDGNPTSGIEVVVEPVG